MLSQRWHDAEWTDYIQSIRVGQETDDPRRHAAELTRLYEKLRRVDAWDVEHQQVIKCRIASVRFAMTKHKRQTLQGRDKEDSLSLQIMKGIFVLAIARYMHYVTLGLFFGMAVYGSLIAVAALRRDFFCGQAKAVRRLKSTRDSYYTNPTVAIEDSSVSFGALEEHSPAGGAVPFAHIV